MSPWLMLICCYPNMEMGDWSTQSLTGPILSSTSKLTPPHTYLWISPHLNISHIGSHETRPFVNSHHSSDPRMKFRRFIGLKKLYNCYRPQTKFGKVMFSQASGGIGYRSYNLPLHPDMGLIPYHTPSHWYWHLVVATESPTFGTQTVRILLECCLVSSQFTQFFSSLSDERWSCRDADGLCTNKTIYQIRFSF